jgi:uncharacterized membrane protein (DUF2068 family)
MVWWSAAPVNPWHFVAAYRGDAPAPGATHLPGMPVPRDFGAPRPRPRRADLGFSVIVAYKLLKAAVQTVAAVALEGALFAGATERLHDFAVTTAHGTSRVSELVARAVGQLTTTRHVHILVLALSMDAVLSLVEGLALHRRYRWAPWLIVVATAAALPFEVVSLAHALRPLRLMLFLVNLALLVYLVRRALLHARP